MSAPSPGPWKARKQISASRIPSLYIYTGTKVHDFDDIAEVYTNASHDGDWNARLIAAAPDLLDAAKRWLHEFDLYNAPPRQAALDAERDLRAAIARAEGDS